MAIKYNISQDYLFSFIVETKLGSTVAIDTPPLGTQSEYVFTKDDADAIYRELTGNSNATYINKFSTSNQFKFYWYASDGFYKWQNAPATASLPVYRKFDVNNQELRKLIKAAKPDLAGYFTKNEVSNKKYTITFDYNIQKLGWATTSQQREENKRKIFDKIGLGKKDKTSKEDMDRIIKIMAFLLSRERGYSWKEDKGQFEILTQRELGIICWCLINTSTSTQFAKNKNSTDLLSLLKNEGYSNYKPDTTNGKIATILGAEINNPPPFVRKNNTDTEITKETAIMKIIYDGNANEAKYHQNLEYFVLAFFAGWINEEIPGVTNWDHLTSGITKFSGQHLPRTPAFKDPDVGSQINLQLYIKKDGSDENVPGTVSIPALKNQMVTIKTSSGPTYTLDGNVIFTIYPS